MGLLRGLFLIGVGVYGGIYVAQNYRVPQVDRPEALWNKAKEWFEEFDREYKKTKAKRDD